MVDVFNVKLHIIFSQKNTGSYKLKLSNVNIQ